MASQCSTSIHVHNHTIDTNSELKIKLTNIPTVGKGDRVLVNDVMMVVDQVEQIENYIWLTLISEVRFQEMVRVPMEGANGPWLMQ